jgi:hypothetical protein
VAQRTLSKIHEEVILGDGALDLGSVADLLEVGQRDRRVFGDIEERVCPSPCSHQI